MRILALLITSLLFITSCQGQEKAKLDWEKYHEPLSKQLIELIAINDSLFNSITLIENNPLHEKFSSFRNLRIAQNQLIDSLEQLVSTDHDGNYINKIEEIRKIIFRDKNLEKLKSGEKDMVQTIKSIPEIENNSGITALQIFDKLNKEVFKNDSSPYYYTYTSKYSYLAFENAIIKLLPRFDKRREGSGHPEHDTIHEGKYYCTYKTYDYYITLGDHRSKVVAILGQPKQAMNYHKQDSTNYYLYYEKGDHIILHKDTVIGWDNREKTLKVKLEPNINVNSIDYITIGSSKCEVLALLGTPDELDKKVVETSRKLYKCHEKWGYGNQSDYLCFSYKDEVMDYSNRYKSFDVILKNSETANKYFSIGSTKEEVASINGAPDELITDKENRKEHWLYLEGSKTGQIEFENGKVVSVDNRGNLLKFKY